MSHWKRSKAESLSQIELALVLKAIVQGQATDGQHATKKVDGGVYCQFRRNGETEHFNVTVPETFVLNTFVPAEE